MPSILEKKFILGIFVCFPLNTMMAVPILTFEHAGYDLLLRMLGILRQLHGGHLKVTS